MHEGHHHDHEHCCEGAAHTHTHEEGHCHEHHHHHHDHHEEVQVAEKYKKVATLLAYMSNHNADHAQELVDMANQIRTMGLEEAASQIEAGVLEFKKGNEKLQAALELVKKAD